MKFTKSRLFWLLAALAGTVSAADLPVYALTISKGQFIPAELHVPAHTRFKLRITNLGPGPEEFESISLRKESVIAEGVTRNVVFAPLKPGQYRFIGEFHADSAQGVLIVE